MTTDQFLAAEWVEGVHEALVNPTAVLIVLHVLCVLVTSFQKGENLARTMIVGRNRRA